MTRLRNSLLAENLAAAAPDCDGTLESSGHNLIADASCSVAAATGDQLDVDAELAAAAARRLPDASGQSGSRRGERRDDRQSGRLLLAARRRRHPASGRRRQRRRQRAATSARSRASGIAPLDVDGDGRVSALTDGILILRYLFGFGGDVLTTGAAPIGSPRSTGAAVIAYCRR